MPQWPGVLQGGVVQNEPETPNVDRFLALLRLVPPPVSGVVVSFNRDIGQGLVRLDDGRVLKFSPDAFHTATPRVPAPSTLVVVHFTSTGALSAVRVKSEVSPPPGASWYEWLMADDDTKEPEPKLSTTEWFKTIDIMDRKRLLSLLHDVRPMVNQWPSYKKSYAEFEQLLRHLEDDHEVAKKV